MKVHILDDWFDSLRGLRCFDLLSDHDVTVWTDHEPDPVRLSDRVKEAEALGIARDLPPGQIHSLKDLMMPALVRAGLVTPRSKAMFEAAGIPVNADLSVLESMEDAKSDANVLNAEQAAY